MSESPFRLNIERIREYLPHRYPFLLIDRIAEIHAVGNMKDVHADDKVGTRVVGIKNYTYNEQFMSGHFPYFSIAPGVLLVESMAQTASFSIYPWVGEYLRKTGRKFEVVLAGIDATRFRRPVVPGDTVKIETVVKKKRGKLWIFECKSTVEGQLVAETEVMANLTLDLSGLNAENAQ